MLPSITYFSFLFLISDCGLLTQRRRNSMSKFLEMRVKLKLDGNILA